MAQKQSIDHLFIVPVVAGLDINKDSMKTVYDYFKLEPGTRDFIGHAMALYLDDELVSSSTWHSLHLTVFPDTSRSQHERHTSG